MVIMGDNFNVLPWWTWLILLITIMGTLYGMNALYKKRRKNSSPV
jgi:hypothetical protein